MSSIITALVFNLVPTIADIAIAAVYFCLAFELTISVVILTSLPPTACQSSPLPRPAFSLSARTPPSAPCTLPDAASSAPSVPSTTPAALVLVCASVVADSSPCCIAACVETLVL